MMITPEFHTFWTADIRREAAEAISFALAVPGELAPAYRYAAGQYLTLCATLDGQDVRRSYSVCTAPELTTRDAFRRAAADGRRDHARGVPRCSLRAPDSSN